MTEKELKKQKQQDAKEYNRILRAYIDTVKDEPEDAMKEYKKRQEEIRIHITKEREALKKRQEEVTFFQQIHKILGVVSPNPAEDAENCLVWIGQISFQSPSSS